MKRTHVLNYNILGSAAAWPIEVDVSQNERKGTWTLYFRWTDDELPGSETVCAGDVAAIPGILEERSVAPDAFFEALLASNNEELVGLSKQLRGQRNQRSPVFAHIETNADQFYFDGPKPPESARLVASVGWSWGDSGTFDWDYLLSSDKQRSGWFLWARATDECTEKPMFRYLAKGTPYSGISAKDAAEQLLLASWSAEPSDYGEYLTGSYSVHEGLLRREDIERLVHAVVGGL
jgi:hypothetical protein